MSVGVVRLGNYGAATPFFSPSVHRRGCHRICWCCLPGAALYRNPRWRSASGTIWSYTAVCSGNRRPSLTGDFISGKRWSLVARELKSCAGGKRMKIQCNACESAEANVLCCADEAALCWACDEKVHAANKLASKHQRVPLSSSSSQIPKCDICQESVGYFFCLEDRALLCRKCDVAVHSANSFVSVHQRFLLTGVKVALELSNAVPCSSKDRLRPAEKMPLSHWSTWSSKSTSNTTFLDRKEILSNRGDRGEGLPVPVARPSFTGGTAMSGVIPDWPIEDFLGLTDLNQNFGFSEQGSSKADHGKQGDSSEWSPIYHATTGGELDVDECLGQVPEIYRAVPEIPSPPTASGLYWPKNYRTQSAENSVFVPDVSSPSWQAPYMDHSSPIPKRRRHF